MAKTCDNCISKGMSDFKDMPPVPFAAHESALARSERHNKRLWIVILVLIGALIGTNLAWIVYESHFEDVVTTTEENILVDADDNGVANYIGNDGDIYNVEDYNKKENDN